MTVEKLLIKHGKNIRGNLPLTSLVATMLINFPVHRHVIQRMEKRSNPPFISTVQIGRLREIAGLRRLYAPSVKMYYRSSKRIDYMYRRAMRCLYIHITSLLSPLHPHISTLYVNSPCRSLYISEGACKDNLESDSKVKSGGSDLFADFFFFF